MSWEQLGSIFASAAAEREANDETAPTACPDDGEPLLTDPHGHLRCSFDGWVWDGRPIRY